MNPDAKARLDTQLWFCEEILKAKSRGDAKGARALRAGFVTMYNVVMHSRYERPESDNPVS